MPTDPRTLMGWDEQDAHFQSIGSDTSITPPVLSITGLTNSPSAQQGAAVTNVATGTGVPLAGLGTSGNRLLGRVKAVDGDGVVTLQDRGYATFAYVTGGSVPVVNSPVDVDGTGKVLVSATHRGRYCEGFMVDPQSGSTVCIVRMY
jgi:hypothetical protein